MNPHYASVARRAFHRCEYCHAPELVFNFRFEVEHVIPVAQGGEDDEANLALACRSCNLHKGTDVTGVDPSSGEVVRLFVQTHARDCRKGTSWLPSRRC